MWFFYFFAIIPAVVGALLWVRSKEVVWWEWLVGSGVGFLLAGIFHLTSFCAVTGDTETWSGRVISAAHHPWWKERYTETQMYTTGSGKNQTTHFRTVTKYRDHPERWTCDSTLGEIGEGLFGLAGISQSRFLEIAKVFECAPAKTPATKLGLCAGDPNIYVVTNKVAALVPVTTTKSWTNRVQASPNVFSFIDVPDNVPVYAYPQSVSPWVSGRLLGSAKCVGIYEWDQMNSRLGPTKKVNILLVAFNPDADSMLGQYQEAKWFGGKKNDLVITYAGSPCQLPKWVYTFGWTEQEIVKRNLDALVGRTAIDKDVISLIESEVRENYVIKDWSKFDYIGISPPGWAYPVFLLAMVAAQTGFYFFAHSNAHKKKEILVNRS